MAKTERRIDYFGAIRNFLQEVGQEQKKVVWPTREILMQSTFVVIFIIIVLTVYLAIIDVLSRKVFGYLM
ncbi:MAG: preprotein translocase subunit SecE [bacterium]